MTPATNGYGQSIGPARPEWSKRPYPAITQLIGRYCHLEKLSPERHLAELHSAFTSQVDDRDWTYLPYGPFPDLSSYSDHLQQAARQTDPLHFAIIDRSTNKAVGSIALMRIDPDNGVIEIGHVAYSPLLQKSKAGTEAMYLLMRRIFAEMGYRRCEWKCDSLNLPSRRAAERYGFKYEGTFRQAVVYKGRSRDTAWFSIIDSEWPVVSSALEKWLSPENFDPDGRQRHSLASLRDATK